MSTDVYTALPSVQSLHQMLGIREPLLLSAVQALPIAGQRYGNYSGSGAPFILGFDTAEAPGTYMSFLHLWTKARLSGMRVPFEEFSYGAMAAREGRIPSPPEGLNDLGANYGYHLDAAAYSSMLKQICAKREVVSVRTGSVRVETDGARIAAVHLPDGEAITADLFIDASGSEAKLLSCLPGSGITSWADDLPCDRLLSISAKTLPALPAFSQISAFRAGWVGVYPLPYRTGVITGFSSAFMDDQEALDSTVSWIPLAFDGDAVAAKLEVGARERPWLGNCVALGEAAGTFEPLDGIPLHFTHICISNLIDLFPVRRDEFQEAECYNHRIRSNSASLKDFQAARYRLNRRFDEPLWDAVRRSVVIDPLQEMIDLFSARGIVQPPNGDTLGENSWAAMFIGHGLKPNSYDPRADLISEAEHMQMIKARLAEIATKVPNLPTAAAFLPSRPATAL
jgi:tryptophan halogenase